MGDSVKSLDEIEVDNIRCSPLVYPVSQAIIEGYEIEHISHSLFSCAWNCLGAFETVLCLKA